MTPWQEASYAYHSRCVQSIHDDLVEVNNRLIKVMANLQYGTDGTKEALIDILMKLSCTQGEASYVKRSMGAS